MIISSRADRRERHTSQVGYNRPRPVNCTHPITGINTRAIILAKSWSGDRSYFPVSSLIFTSWSDAVRLVYCQRWQKAQGNMYSTMSHGPHKLVPLLKLLPGGMGAESEYIFKTIIFLSHGSPKRPANPANPSKPIPQVPCITKMGSNTIA